MDFNEVHNTIEAIIILDSHKIPDKTGDDRTVNRILAGACSYLAKDLKKASCSICSMMFILGTTIDLARRIKKEVRK